MLCSAPFVSPCITPDGFKLCSSPAMKSFSDINDWNSEYAQKVRKGLLEYDPIDICRECITVRKGGLGTFDVEPIPSTIVPLTFKVLRIARSNKCELACEMCSADISHSYDKTYNDGKLGIIENNYDIMKHVHEIESLAISGGNPTLDKKLLPLITGADNHNCRNMIFTSNGMSFPQSFIDVFNQLNMHCVLLFSIDAHAEVNEVVRLGAKQSRIYDTIRHVMNSIDNPNINYMVETTLTRKTVMHMMSLYKELKENLDFNKFNVWCNVCFHPEELSIKHITEEEKHVIRTRFIPYFEFENNHIAHRFKEACQNYFD